MKHSDICVCGGPPPVVILCLVKLDTLSFPVSSLGETSSGEAFGFTTRNTVNRAPALIYS